MKLSQLIHPDECLSGFPPSDPEITSVAWNQKDITPGCLFLCIHGANESNPHLLASYFSRGAKIVVCEPEENPAIACFPVPGEIGSADHTDEEACGNSQGIVLCVPSVRRAYAFLYSRWNNSPQDELTMIGITGTNGKSTTATMLDACLRHAGYAVGLIGTIACTVNGNPIAPASNQTRLTTMTTPDPDILYPLLRRMRKMGVTHVVMEVSSHALALEKVSPIRFETAIFTNLSPEHLDFHTTLAEYGEVKERLFRMCRHAIVNCDDEFGSRLADRLSCPVTRCGIVWGGDVRAEQIVDRGIHGCCYLYRNPPLCNRVSIALPGQFNVYNSLFALTAALHLGVTGHTAVEALETLSAVPGRMEVVNRPEDDITVLIDYAHTEAALRNLLRTAQSIPHTGIIRLVFGCGGERDHSKRAPMGRAAEELADYTYITSDNCRNEEATAIIRDILAGFQNREARRVIVNRERAIHTAISDADAGDLILVAGKGHETYEIRRGEILPFDERKIIRSAIEERRRTHTNTEGDTDPA